MTAHQAQACVTRLRKGSADADADLRDANKCFSNVATVGSDSSGDDPDCPRQFNVILVHVALPQVPAGWLGDVELTLDVTQVVSGGIDAALHGLGQRGATADAALSRQSSADFYAGVSDPAPASQLISSSLIVQHSLAPEEDPVRVSWRSPSLTAYVASQLEAGGAGQMLALRVSGASFYGCDTSCSDGCPLQRYRIDASSAAVTFFELIMPPMPPPLPQPHG